MYVAKALVKLQALQFIGKFILERNDINVMCVARRLDHINVMYVARPLV